MSYQDDYRQKLTTADEAVKVVKSGDWVDYGFCTTTAYALDIALAKRASELSDVKIRGGILTRRPAIADVPNAPEHFTWNSWHMTGIERKMLKEGLAFYAPLRYSELPRYYRENLPDIDVALLQVAPMDEHGWFNFGPTPSHLAAMCERAKVIIVEVNKNIPYCMGG
ncbi:MAG: butyryl-CoA:acetate CoA-transferase, partial [Oscillibacter sp.]|nr:butyryl-CoA:acetate CoA-transferase [Oscillibacter sp.]